MKVMIFGTIGVLAVVFLLGFGIFFLMGEEASRQEIPPGGEQFSDEVLAYRPLVEKYAEEAGILEHVLVLLAIMQVESGGLGNDVMQASESLGLPPNAIPTPEQSIQQGCRYFAALLKTAEAFECDLNTVIQAYNYGGAFILYAAENGKNYHFDLAVEFARGYAGGKKVTYNNPIAIAQNGGWRYAYGNMFYVLLISQYLIAPQFSDEMVQSIMSEALKYQGYPYVFGGASPTTSFDCSGLIQWCYATVGISLAHSAQGQYEVAQHIPMSEARPGDLIFFNNTYQTSNYITHVGIYVGDNKMYHAGDPIGYTDLSYSYWQKHFVTAGRVIQQEGSLNQ